MTVTGSEQRRITVVRSSPRYAEQMQDLMHLVYDTTRENPDGTFLAAQFRRHMEIFPEGQFVALEAGRVVGLTASMRLPFEPANPFIESWYETISSGWLTRHDPRAEWMYGVESCVNPKYQGSGIGGKLMEARFSVAKALNLRGMVAGSDIMSYPALAHRATPEEYLRGVVEGTYFDNNLTKQLRKGFRAVALIPNYLGTDWGVVIVWDNPTFDPTRPIGQGTITQRRTVITPRPHK